MGAAQGRRRAFRRCLVPSAFPVPETAAEAVQISSCWLQCRRQFVLKLFSFHGDDLDPHRRGLGHLRPGHALDEDRGASFVGVSRILRLDRPGDGQLARREVGAYPPGRPPDAALRRIRSRLRHGSGVLDGAWSLLSFKTATARCVAGRTRPCPATSFRQATARTGGPR